MFLLACCWMCHTTAVPGGQRELTRADTMGHATQAALIRWSKRMLFSGFTLVGIVISMTFQPKALPVLIMLSVMYGHFESHRDHCIRLFVCSVISGVPTILFVWSSFASGEHLSTETPAQKNGWSEWCLALAVPLWGFLQKICLRRLLLPLVQNRAIQVERWVEVLSDCTTYTITFWPVHLALCWWHVWVGELASISISLSLSHSLCISHAHMHTQTLALMEVTVISWLRTFYTGYIPQTCNAWLCGSAIVITTVLRRVLEHGDRRDALLGFGQRLSMAGCYVIVVRLFPMIIQTIVEWCHENVQWFQGVGEEHYELVTVQSLRVIEEEEEEEERKETNDKSALDFKGLVIGVTAQYLWFATVCSAEGTMYWSI